MTNDIQYEFDIFISYNRADEEWANQLATRLEREDWQGRKLKVFFAPWDIKPGESISERLEDALPRSRKVGLILSPEAVESEWVKVERYVTQHIDITERQKRLIPLYLRTCKIPTFLNHINYVDFRDDKKVDQSYRILLATIKDEPLPRGEQPSSIQAASLPPAIPRPPAVGFVPRHHEDKSNVLDKLIAELAPENNQLVVLWGRGGAGKTTLAAEAMREISKTSSVRIVWISALSHADLTLSTLLNEIAAQLGRTELRPLPPEEKEEQVRALIGSAPTLIVLDNFETIKLEEQKACVRFLAENAPCPALITTRSEIYEDEVNNISLDAMLLEEARDLLGRLIKRTRKREKFDAFDHDDIIQKTEFNPLLLKWVVRQIDLAKNPETALNYLAKGDTEVAKRIFDRSFDLDSVSDDARSTLLALSLFVPDASSEALAEVAGFKDDLLRLDKAVENLAAVWLIDSTVEGERLVIRGLAYERAKVRLSEDERVAEFRQRFVAYFLRYTEAHANPTPEDYDALEREKDNTLGAIDVAFEIGDWLSGREIVNVLAAPIDGVLDVRGYWDEAIKRNEQARDMARKRGLELEAAVLSHRAAIIRRGRGEYDAARIAVEEALAIYRKLNQKKNESTALHELGILAQAQGELTKARQLYDKSMEIDEKLGDQKYIAISLHELGRLAHTEGDLATAQRLYDESLEIEKSHGNQGGIAMTLHQLAMLAEEQGNLVEARKLYDESLGIEKKLGNLDGIAQTLAQLALLTAEEGNREEAVRLLHEALAIFEKLKSPYVEITRQYLEILEKEPS